MNMPPHAERGAATKSRLLCRNLSRLMKSMRTALGAPARCTARCGVSPTSTMPCRATIKSRTFWQRWAGFILIFLPTAGRSFALSAKRMDEISFERDVLYHRANDGLDAYRVERNRLMKAYAKEIGNVKQQKYLILSTNKQNSKDARERLNQVQRNMLGELSNIGCKVCALDNNARLEVLHNFFRIGEETHFQFDLTTAPDWDRIFGMPLRRMQCAFAKTTSRLTIPMPSA